jgi:tetratricopeptide (TPR) repeat protein
LADDLVSPLAGSDPETLAGSIELERSAHRLDRALALVKKAQEAGISDDAKTRLALTAAALLKEQGQSDEALATLLAVPKTSPLFFEARVRAAELLREQGKTSEAARAGRKTPRPQQATMRTRRSMRRLRWPLSTRNAAMPSWPRAGWRRIASQPAGPGTPDLEPGHDRGTARRLAARPRFGRAAHQEEAQLG